MWGKLPVGVGEAEGRETEGEKELDTEGGERVRLLVMENPRVWVEYVKDREKVGEREGGEGVAVAVGGEGRGVCERVAVVVREGVELQLWVWVGGVGEAVQLRVPVMLGCGVKVSVGLLVNVCPEAVADVKVGVPLLWDTDAEVQEPVSEAEG